METAPYGALDGNGNARAVLPLRAGANSCLAGRFFYLAAVSYEDNFWVGPIGRLSSTVVPLQVLP